MVKYYDKMDVLMLKDYFFPPQRKLIRNQNYVLPISIIDNGIRINKIVSITIPTHDWITGCPSLDHFW